jgi:hypothetical protein
VIAVTKPLDERSDDELESGLVNDEFKPSKKTFAEEILRRRYKAKSGWVWLADLWPKILGFVGRARNLRDRFRAPIERQRPSD